MPQKKKDEPFARPIQLFWEEEYGETFVLI